MKIDVLFPPAPPFDSTPLPCADLTPDRLRALARLSAFATEAERLVGSLSAATDAPAPPFPATTRGFAQYCFRDSPFAAELAELLARSKINITANDHVDVPHVMVIDVRRYWGVLGPIRGDIVVFADGQVSVVTKALCHGCQHFEGVSLQIEAPVQVVKRTHWTSTVMWILRLVDESPEAVPAPAEAAPVAPAPADAAPASPAPAPADGAPAPARKKKTGIG